MTSYTKRSLKATPDTENSLDQVVFTKIAQMLTSRIGKKPLLLTLAATLACLQTAMAAKPNPSWRSAKATLEGKPCSNGLNSLRRRLPDAGAAAHLETLKQRDQERLQAIDRELEAQIAIRDQTMESTDGFDYEDDLEFSGGGKQNARQEAIEKMEQARQEAIEKIEQLEAEKAYLESRTETGLQRMRRGFQEAPWWKQGLAAGGLAIGMGGGIATAITLTKAGFKDLKDPSDGTADLPHMGGAMFGLVVFFVCYLYTMYLIFGANMQFGVITALSGVGSALALGGMITMLVAPAASTMESYGQSLIFGETDKAVTWLFSIGWIFMALALVSTVSFVLYNKTCAKPDAAA